MGVGGADRFFRTDWRGGEGGRVEAEWRFFVNSRETEAVALEVLEMGATVGGDRNEGRGGSRGVLLLLLGELACCGCLPRMVRRDSSVRSTCKLSEEDEDDEADSSSIGGVIGRTRGDVFARIGVKDRERNEVGDVEVTGEDFPRSTRRMVLEPELVLELLPLRGIKENRGDEDTEPDVLEAGGKTT